TLRGLDEARSADVVFAELYTSGLAGATVASVEQLVGKKIRVLSRTDVEDGRTILEAAAKQKVAFLVVGDPMAATTHVDLRLRPGDAGLRPEPGRLAGGPRHRRAHGHALGSRLGTAVALHRDPGAPAFPREGGAHYLRRGASRPLNGRLREFRDPVDPPERH